MAGGRSLGTLTVDLVTRYAGFEQGMTAAERVGERRARAIAGNQRKYAKESAQAWEDMARTSGDSIETIGAKVVKLGEKSEGAARLAKQAFAAVFAGAGVAGLVDMADTWGQYASRIEMATQSADEYEHAQKRLVQSAKDTFRAVNEAREGFIQMSPPLRSLGLSLDQSIDVIDTFSGLLVVNAASADKGRSAMDALSSSIQKGKIDANAWTSIASTMPTIVDEIAKTTGKTAAEIRALGVAGKIGINEVVNTLLQQYEPTMKRVAEMPTTVADALGALRDEFQEFIGQQNKAVGATGLLVDGINVLSGNFNTLAAGALAALVVGMARYTAGAGASAAASAWASYQSQRKAATELAEARASAVSTAATLSKVHALSMVSANTAQATAATLAHEAALKRVAVAQAAYTSLGRIALGVLGGPAGLAITAGLVAVGFASMRSKSEDAKSGLSELTEHAEALREKLQTLNRDQQKAILADAIAKSKDAAKDADEAFTGFVDTVARGFRDRLGNGFAADFKKELNEARASGGSLTEVIDRFASRAVISPDTLNSWYQYAGRVGDSERASKTAADRANELADAIRGVQGATFGAGGGLQAFSEQANKTLADLDKRIALFGKRGSGAEIRYELSLGDKGQYKDASAEQKADLLRRADQLDLMQRQADAQKRGASASSQQATSAQQYIKALRDQVDKAGELTTYEKLLRDLREGTLKITNAALLKEAERLAIQADFAKDGKEREKERKQLQEEGKRLTEQTRTPLEQMRVEQERINSLYAEGVISIQTQTRALEQARAAAMGISGDTKKWIRGDVQPLQGGMFDQQLERYKAEAEAENQRYAAQQERLEQAYGGQYEYIAEYYLQAEQLAQEHAGRMSQIDKARFQTTLGVASDGFGQLANAFNNASGEQSSAYKTMFAASKAFSIAQASLNLGTALGNAFQLPWPANLGAAAAAAGYMATIIANIRAVSGTGFAQGGYTGDGGKYEPAGVVHRGEVVWSQADISRAGGVGVVEAMRRGARGYADGGIVAGPRMPTLTVPSTSPKASDQGGGMQVIIQEDASRAGQVEWSDGEFEEKVARVFVSNIRRGGSMSQVMESTYGQRRMGR